MMIGVEHPQRTMHQVFVRRPCHRFHPEKKSKEYSDVL
jgi:hypothetical protein